MSSGIKFPWTLIKNLQLSRRNFTQNQCESKKSWEFILRKLAFEWSGYNKYGLYTHDIIDYNDPVVCETLRRLPMDMLDARNFRYFNIYHELNMDLLSNKEDKILFL